MRRFQIDQLLHQSIEFTIADVRPRLHVIQVIVMMQLCTKLFDSLLDRGRHCRRFYAANRELVVSLEVTDSPELIAPVTPDVPVVLVTAGGAIPRAVSSQLLTHGGITIPNFFAMHV